MITANERISRASYTAPNEVNNILESVESFIKDTQTQISTVTTSSVQITMDALHRDLEGKVDKKNLNSVRNVMSSHFSH